MMPGHWHASLARRRHPQAILATGLITRRPTWYFGTVGRFRCWGDQPSSTGGAFWRPIARSATRGKSATRWGELLEALPTEQGIKLLDNALFSDNRLSGISVVRPPP
jgi:hypothetical protein